MENNSSLDQCAYAMSVCDSTGKIVYNNEAAKILSKKLGLTSNRMDDLLGDQDLSGLLANPKRNLPCDVKITMDGEVLDVKVSAHTGAEGDVGLLAAWQLVTDKESGAELNAFKAGMVDTSPVNQMACDMKGLMTYLNPASIKTLKSIEKVLPCRVSEMIGKPFDIFHKDPSFQQGLLKDPHRNFPRKAILDFNGVMLDLTASLLINESGDPVGLQACWELVTDKIKLQKEAALKSSMVEGAPTNMMTTDMSGTLTYLNPASIETMRRFEHKLPVRVDQLIGTSFDIFHKDPAFQRSLLKDPERNFPRRAQIDYNGLIMDLSATLLRDADGTAIGLQACWEDITAQVEAAAAKEKIAKGISENTALVASSSTELSSSTEEMSSSLESTVQQIRRSSEQSEQMSMRMETIMASTEEMTMAIKEISSGAQESAKIANQAVEQAKEANTIVKNLGDSSKEINNVIKAISSVAQQTNLLALNATIEAARAGEAGKGFAVVASEVKELAKETRSATEDITQKIERIQEDTARAVRSIQSITEIINRLNEIANSTASSVEEQSVTTNDISQHISEANTGVGQISENMTAVMDQMSQVAEGVRQNAEAASGLSQVAEKLNSLVKD